MFIVNMVIQDIAEQIAMVQIKFLLTHFSLETLNSSLADHDMPCLSKQCRSREAN